MKNLIAFPVECEHECSNSMVLRDSGGDILAECVSQNDDLEQVEIDRMQVIANLLNASGDLLAACEAVVAHRDAIAKQYGYESGDYYEGYGEVMSMIESAITKARGVEV